MFKKKQVQNLQLHCFKISQLCLETFMWKKVNFAGRINAAHNSEIKYFDLLNKLWMYCAAWFLINEQRIQKDTFKN